MTKLIQMLSVLESKISLATLQNEAISKSTVGWQIEHCAITINIIVKAIQNSDPTQYKWTFNFTRTIIFALKKIPRGKAKAPKIVQPTPEFDATRVKNELLKAKTSVITLQSINPDHYFEHPYFGHLKVKNAIPFLEIHTQHHLDIINDIIKSK